MSQWIVFKSANIVNPKHSFISSSHFPFMVSLQLPHNFVIEEKRMIESLLGCYSSFRIIVQECFQKG